MPPKSAKRSNGRRQATTAAPSQVIEPKTEYLTPEEVATLCGVSIDTVNGWIKSGDLKAFDFAGSNAKRRRWRVTREQLENFKQRRASVTPVEPIRRQRPDVPSKAFY